MINDIDFIRYLMDIIAKKEAPAPAAPTVVINIDRAGNVSSDSEEVETAMDKDDVFIPPLQAKIEMMKKMSGIEPKNQDLLSSDDDEPLDG